MNAKHHSPVINHAEQRAHKRYATQELAKLEIEGRAYTCTLVDISAGGASIRISPAVEIPGGRGVLLSEKFGNFTCNVRYRSLDAIGVQFDLAEYERQNLKRKLEQHFGD